MLKICIKNSFSKIFIFLAEHLSIVNYTFCLIFLRLLRGLSWSLKFLQLAAPHFKNYSQIITPMCPGHPCFHHFKVIAMVLTMAYQQDSVLALRHPTLLQISCLQTDQGFSTLRSLFLYFLYLNTLFMGTTWLILTFF